MEEKAQHYARIKRQLWLADLGLGFLLWGVLILSPLAYSLGRWVTQQSAHWPIQVALFVGILWIGMTLIGLPLAWIRGFWVEHRFGLSNQSLVAWLAETGKGLAIGAVLGLVLVEGFCWLLRATPEFWWFWAALAWLVWSVVLARLAPTLLIPIFYKQSPLADKTLRDRLTAFLEACGANVRGIFEINLSKTTKKANACLCGMGQSRRVLVSDTLLEQHPAEEVEVVLAHEVGHHRLHHIGILIATSAVTAGISCWAVHQILGLWMTPLGLSGLTDLATLPVIGFLLSVANLVLMPVVHGLSRRLEAQADRFALEKTGNPQAFIATMERLGEQNLAELSPPRWVEWLLYDHPSLARRIAMAEQEGT